MHIVNFRNYRIIKLFIAVLLLMILVACSMEPDVDADDFGFPKVNLQFTNNIDYTTDSGYVYNGKRLTIIVKRFGPTSLAPTPLTEIEILLVHPQDHSSHIANSKQADISLPLTPQPQLTAQNQLNLGYNGVVDENKIGHHIYLHIKYGREDLNTYQVIFKSGVSSITGKIFGKMITQTDTMLRNATKNIYKASINPANTELITYIRIMLTIYLIMICFSFIIGVLQISNKEFFIVLFKVAIITVLISEYSFDFFNNYLFVFFQDGMYEIINMMKGTEFNTSHAHDKLAVFDELIQPYISPETQKKLWAITTSGLLGFVVAVAIIYIIGQYVFHIMKAVVFFLMAKIAITLLIILSPFAITCSLFKISKSIYDNWLKFLISFTLQPIILIASISLVNNVILTEFHKILGYKVTQVATNIQPTTISNSIYYTFFPGHVPYSLKLINDKQEFDKYNISDSKKSPERKELEDAKNNTLSKYNREINDLDNLPKLSNELTYQKNQLTKSKHILEAELSQYNLDKRQIALYVTSEQILYKFGDELDKQMNLSKESLMRKSAHDWPSKSTDLLPEQQLDFLKIAANQTDNTVASWYIWNFDTSQEIAQEILVPVAFIREGGYKCAAYECTDGLRYPSLPYLKLAEDATGSCYDHKHLKKGADQCRIDAIKGGTVVSYFEMFSLLLLVYLFVQFYRAIPLMTRELANVSLGFFTNLQDAISPPHQDRFFISLNRIPAKEDQRGALTSLESMTNSVSRSLIGYTPDDLYNAAYSNVTTRIGGWTSKLVDKTGLNQALVTLRTAITSLDTKMHNYAPKTYAAAKGLGYIAMAPIKAGIDYRNMNQRIDDKKQKESDDLMHELQDPNARSIRKTFIQAETAFNNPLDPENGLYSFYHKHKRK